jgi:hypothetical protein
MTKKEVRNQAIARAGFCAEAIELELGLNFKQYNRVRVLFKKELEEAMLEVWYRKERENNTCRGGK